MKGKGKHRVKSVEESGKTRPKKAPLLDLTMRRSSVTLVRTVLVGGGLAARLQRKR